MSEGKGPGVSRDKKARVSPPRLFKFGRSTSKTASTKPTKVKLFGVDLKDVLKRSPSVEPKYPQVPKFLNDILSYIEKRSGPGLNPYRDTSQVKSKIQQARHSLNYGEAIDFGEPRIAAGLVRQFLRELPTHVLGSVMERKLEGAKPTEKKTRKIQNLYQKDVSDVNKAVFERLMLHMEIIGIDLTPLLRTSQKALLMLKPVMSPWSLEDELKVEEARLARMHLSLTKAGPTEAKASKTREKQDLDGLWEAQRNVTQLKRKLKHSVSLSAANIQEARMNLRERCGDEREPETRTTAAVSQPEAGTLRRNRETATAENRAVATSEKSIADGARLSDHGSSKESFMDTKENADNHALTSNQNESKALPAPEPNVERVLRPNPVSGSEALQSEPTIQDGNGAAEYQIDESLAPSMEEFTEESAVEEVLSESRRTEPPTPSEKELLDDGELVRLQQEWKDVIGEQAELLRMRDDIKRRIRDEHKQIKMIQMVRNHRSRLTSTKPAYLVSQEKMSTPQLGEALSRLIESNARLTQDSQTLADKVFKERMGLVSLRASNRQSLLS